MIPNGTLAWPFTAQYTPPGTSNSIINSTVIHNLPSNCIDNSDCQCEAWDCGLDIVCHWGHDWTSCKCSLIRDYNGGTKGSCDFEVFIMRFLLYASIAIISISIIAFSIRCYESRHQNTSKKFQNV